MIYIIYSLIILLIIIVLYHYYTINKYKKHQYSLERQKQEFKIHKELSDLYKKRDILNNEIEQKQLFNNSLLLIKEQELDKILNEKKIQKEQLINSEINEWSKSAQEAANYNFTLIQEKYIKDYTDFQTLLNYLKEEINNYKEKRDAINQENIRQRQIQEQEEFYKIQLPEESQKDIENINSIRQKIIKLDLFDKLIYDNYINRPAKDMIKRVLNGENPTGIYKITNIKTNEVYIGKSVKIADRWANHIKAACGLGGVAESQFQRALRRYGIENFTWELLEEVSKDNLTEREKYYINFYDTKNYGYNQREG